MVKWSVVAVTGIVGAAAGLSVLIHDGAGYLDVNVQYAGMASYDIPAKQTLRLKSPAQLSDLQALVYKDHPVLNLMDGMQVLLNGTSAYGDPLLSNGDVIAFVAQFNGG